MKLQPTAIDGVVTVQREEHRDERGFFARLHCPEEFAAAGFPFAPAQTSLSRNKEAGTLRGLHWQAPPFAETKLVRVVRGRSFHVFADVRAGSLTACAWVGLELDAETGGAVLVGPGIAHGFLTREPNTDVLYQIAPAYVAGHARGARWDDPAFAIDWPARPALVALRDLSFPAYDATDAAQGGPP